MLYFLWVAFRRNCKIRGLCAIPIGTCDFMKKGYTYNTYRRIFSGKMVTTHEHFYHVEKWENSLKMENWRNRNIMLSAALRVNVLWGFLLFKKNSVHHHQSLLCWFSISETEPVYYTARHFHIIISTSFSEIFSFQATKSEMEGNSGKIVVLQAVVVVDGSV